MLDIDMEFRKGILFVRLRGVLNGDTALELDENLTSIITDNGIKYLLINLNELTYIDKYGLKVIFKNYQNININNGKFCSECGKPAPASEWTCECGAVNSGKFCGQCGKPRP